MMRRLLALGALLLAAGCSTSARDLPLPGSGMAGDTYRLSATFDDALNLADGAPVKLHGVTVGRVHDVRAEDFTAVVRFDLSADTEVHEGVSARLRSTTPLGELFVQLDDPGTGAALTDGDRVGTTEVAPTIEDTMAAASMVINGGGLGQLDTIVGEANAMLGGRETAARDLITDLERTVSTLDASGDDLETMLTVLADVSAALDDHRATIDALLDELPRAASSLRANTDDLVALLEAVDHFGETATSVIGTTREDLLGMLANVGPVIDAMNTLREELGPGSESLIRFAHLIDQAAPAGNLNQYFHFHPAPTLGLPGILDAATPGLTAPAEEKPSLLGDLTIPNLLGSDPSASLGGLLVDPLGALGLGGAP